MHLDDRLLLIDRTPDRPARALQRGAERGELVRIAPGAYLQAAAWSTADSIERHRLLMQAHAARHPGAIFTHRSAAIAHGLPMVKVPPRPELLQPSSRRSSSTPGVLRRTVRQVDEPVRIGMLLAVPLQRTLIDLAAALPLREALVPLDAHRRDGGQEHELLKLLGSRSLRGSRRAERAIAFADGRSANAGESLSRGTMIDLGFPLPDLQVAVPGLPYETDFAWPAHRRRGEFDGFAKYADPRFTGTRALAEVVVAEKRREDAIRAATGDRFVRWTWNEALAVHPLRRALLGAGLPQGRALLRPQH